MRGASAPPPSGPWRDAMAGLRLVAGLPGYLRHRVDPARARAILDTRRRERGTVWLAFLRATVYEGAADNPYRRLLSAAGCAPGDLEALFAREGVEGALRALAAAGVFLSVDELKGRRDVVRGSLRFRVDPATLGNPLTRAHLLRQRSGSRGGQAPVPVDLANLKDRAPNLCHPLNLSPRTHLSGRGSSG